MYLCPLVKINYTLSFVFVAKEPPALLMNSAVGVTPTTQINTRDIWHGQVDSGLCFLFQLIRSQDLIQSVFVGG